jgi:type II secretory pathway pseudopilin PulG
MRRSIQQPRKTQTAFTLVEMIVAVACFGMVTVAIGQFLSNFLIIRFNAEALGRIRSEGNDALDHIDNLVRNGITLPDVCIGSIKPNGSDVSGINFDPADIATGIPGGNSDAIYGDPFFYNDDYDNDGSPDDDAITSVISGRIDPDMTTNRLCLFAPPETDTELFGFNFDEKASVIEANSSRYPFCVPSASGSYYECNPASAEDVMPDLYPQDGTGKESIDLTTPNLNFDEIKKNCAKQEKVYGVLRTNTQEPTAGIYFMRTQIQLNQVVTNNGEKSSIMLYRNRHQDARHARDGFYSISGFSPIQLTNALYGGTFNSPFEVKNLTFFCYFDYFTNGYLVGTEFTVTYERPALTGNTTPIVERFRRLTAVRNPAPFEY